MYKWKKIDNHKMMETNLHQPQVKHGLEYTCDSVGIFLSPWQLAPAWTMSFAPATDEVITAVDVLLLYSCSKSRSRLNIWKGTAWFWQVKCKITPTRTFFVLDISDIFMSDSNFIHLGLICNLSQPKKHDAWICQSQHLSTINWPKKTITDPMRMI